ncbi:MAG: hypothetical protein AB7G87_14475 [Clostridia bacterium]
MSIPRRIENCKNSHLLGQRTLKLREINPRISEDVDFLYRTVIACHAAEKLDNQGKEYIFSIEIEYYEDDNGCLKVKAGNGKFGYIDEYVCMIIPRLVDICETCRKNLRVGDKTYRPAWKADNTPYVWEEEITHCRYHKDGRILAYMTKTGGFSASSIGKNVFLTKEEALKEHERIMSAYPDGLPEIKLHGRR